MIGWEHTFIHEIAHLLEAIVNKTPVGPYGATFEDGYKNAVICEAMMSAAQKEATVAIKY
jgi:predicted dehydrogenase